MTMTRLIDWMKLSPMLLAAAVLAGCGAPTDEAAPVDETIGAESSFDEGDVVVDTYDAEAVEPAPDPEVEAPVTEEPAPVEETPEPAPAEEPATP
ncbi:hypothetical protein [Tautonia rosea]|uniref:hypothetical protein n=1 Tax=Tautonia rosea TaxID=2728037 RepID=UPI001474E1AC|nr:hypothetical protein [Tautonia rosea]